MTQDRVSISPPLAVDRAAVQSGARAAGSIRPGASAVVLGGGLAGIAAAVRLAEAGLRVTLVERRARLGGRATSHLDARTDQLLDNCQHVVLGCCTNLIDLYARLGVADLIEWHDRLHFLDRHGCHDVMRRGGWPAPLHLAGSLMKFRCLGWRAKGSIAAALAGMCRNTSAGNRELSTISFAEWLRRHHQPPEAVERFWNVVVVSALNGTVGHVSAAYALQVFRQGFMAHRDAYLVGLPRVPLVRLYDTAKSLVKDRGGRVVTGNAARALRFDGRRVTGVELRCGRRIIGDVYVSALPFDNLHRIAPDDLRAADARLGRLGEFETSPILGVHLWFDRPVTDLPHMVLVDSPLQWVFNRGVDPATNRQYLHAVISAAQDWVDLPAEEILRRVRGELSAYLPAAVDADLVDGRVIKERRATFAPVPGVDAIRPPASGAVENLFLAGDWCQTGWPATMEGAVRSGYLAAAAVVGHDCLIPELRAAWPMSSSAGRADANAPTNPTSEVLCPSR